MKKGVADAGNLFMSEEEKNPFTLFQIPPMLPVDPDLLKQKYFELQKQAHPDRQNHQETSTNISSAAINTAYQTLKKVSSAAQALLDLKGIQIDNATQQPADLLMTLMELEEKMAWATPDEKKKIIIQIRQEQKAHCHSFMSHYKKETLTTTEAESLIKEALSLQYLERLINRHT
jgi:molecular chaperone HscB